MPRGIYTRTKEYILTPRRLEVLKNMNLLRLGKPRSEETKAKLRLNKGWKHSTKARLKISKATKGKVAWNKGLTGVFTGKNSPHWISDRTKLKARQIRNDSLYQEWHKQVRERDDWKCKMQSKECEGKIEVHHILAWRDYPSLRYEINNGITLCHFHHPRKRVDELRLSPYFQSLLNHNR